MKNLEGKKISVNFIDACEISQPYVEDLFKSFNTVELILFNGKKVITSSVEEFIKIASKEMNDKSQELTKALKIISDKEK